MGFRRAMILLAAVAVISGLVWRWIADVGSVPTRHQTPVAPETGPPPAELHFGPAAFSGADLEAQRGEAGVERGSASMELRVTVQDAVGVPVGQASVVMASDLLTGAAEGQEAETDREGKAVLECRSVQQCQWVLVSCRPYAPALCFIGECWTAEVRRLGYAELKVVMNVSTQVTVRVLSIDGVAIEGAVVRATAAWGEESRESASGLVRSALAPEVLTDASGFATLFLDPNSDFKVECYRRGFAPYSSVCRARSGLGYHEARLLPLYVGGIATSPVPVSEVVMVLDADEEMDRLARNPTWSQELQLGEVEALNNLVEGHRVRWFFRVGSATPPDDLEACLCCPNEQKKVTIGLVPVLDFEVGDITFVDACSSVSPGGSVRIDFVGEKSRYLDEAVGGVQWYLRSAGSGRTALPSRAGIDWREWSGLEKGSWYLGCSRPGWMHYFMSDPVVVEVGLGVETVLTVSYPAISGGSLSWNVVDSMGREVRAFRAFVRGKRGYRAIRGGPLPPGDYALTIEALGYETYNVDCTIREDQDDEIEVVLDLAKPGTMSLGW